MMAQYAETETDASRVLYINSKDATIIYNENTSDFDFTLEEPIVVPEHHSIVMSVYSAEIPYSFYNFQNGINCRLDYSITAFGVPATYNGGILDLGAPGAGTIFIDEGNYNAVQLANTLTSKLAGLEVSYDSIAMKFRFRCTALNSRITMALRYGPFTGTPDAPGDDMNEELGFDWEGLVGDPFIERDAMGQYFYGFNDNTGATISISGPHATSPAYYMYADDVCDMTNSIRSLFIRTNLSTSSVLDSHIGGGFSNILTRIPINAEPGGIINVRPSDGHIHKLLLKIKAITSISIRLTNQKNTTINLNGLNFDISLKLDFIENKILKTPKSGREIVVESQQKAKEKEKLKSKEKTKSKKDK